MKKNKLSMGLTMKQWDRVVKLWDKIYWNSKIMKEVRNSLKK